MRLIFAASWRGFRATSIWMVEQLGLAMMPLCQSRSSGFTSGTTRGQRSSMRQAAELSTTTQPERAAQGANLVEVAPPAEKMARSTPSKESSFSSWTVNSPSPKGTFLPAERAEAKASTSVAGNLRLYRVFSISRPTAPVAPQTATVSLSLMAVSVTREFGNSFTTRKCIFS